MSTTLLAHPAVLWRPARTPRRATPTHTPHGTEPEPHPAPTPRTAGPQTPNRSPHLKDSAGRRVVRSQTIAAGFRPPRPRASLGHRRSTVAAPDLQGTLPGVPAHPPRPTPMAPMQPRIGAGARKKPGKQASVGPGDLDKSSRQRGRAGPGRNPRPQHTPRPRPHGRSPRCTRRQPARLAKMARTRRCQHLLMSKEPGAGRVRGGKPRPNPPGRGQGSPRASLAGPERVRGLCGSGNY